MIPRKCLNCGKVKSKFYLNWCVECYEKQRIRIIYGELRIFRKYGYEEKERQYHKEHIGESHEDRDYLRRRELGSNFLNEYFEGSVKHHINDNDVIYIPGEIHRKFSDPFLSSEEHRLLVLDYYGSIENMKDSLIREN